MADSTSVPEMTDREKLAQAIVAAADLEFSQFKDAITGSVEQRFKDRISQIAKASASKLFNPDAEEPEPEEEFEFEPVDADDPASDTDDPFDDDDVPADPEPDDDDPPADPEPEDPDKE